MQEEVWRQASNVDTCIRLCAPCSRVYCTLLWWHEAAQEGTLFGISL